MKVTSQTRAARALLAYFNHTMVARIVRKVMAESDPAVRKRFANAMLDLIPKAVGDTLYGRVVRDVERRADDHIKSVRWEHRVSATLELNGQRWAEQAMTDRARSYVNSQMKSWEMVAFTKSLSGRLQSAIEDEMRKAAAQAAQAAEAAKVQG